MCSRSIQQSQLAGCEYIRFFSFDRQSWMRIYLNWKLPIRILKAAWRCHHAHSNISSDNNRAQFVFALINISSKKRGNVIQFFFFNLQLKNFIFNFANHFQYIMVPIKSIAWIRWSVSNRKAVGGVGRRC